MRTLTSEQLKFFEKNGYLHLPQFFTQEEIQSFREGCKKNAPGDTMCRPEFKGIMFSPKVVNVMKDLLGEEIIYPGLSLTRTNDFPQKFGSRIFHTDTIDDDLDFSHPYPIINTGIYLQDHKNYSGGLKIIPKSHKRPCIKSSSIRDAIRNIIHALVSGNIRGVWTILNIHRSINIPSMPGDFIVWYVRTHHSGHGARLRLFPNLSLPPVIENWIPLFLKTPENPERNAILSIFAAPSNYLEHYIAKQIRKGYRREHYVHNTCLDTHEYIEHSKKVGVVIRNDGFHYVIKN